MQTKRNILFNTIISRLLLILVLIISTYQISFSQKKAELKDEIQKARWITTLAKYVTWPNDTSDYIKIGVFGLAREYEELKKTELTDSINNKKYQTFRFKNVSKIEYVNILYISKDYRDYVNSISEKIKENKWPTLLMSDSCSESSKFMMNLVLKNRNNLFQINLGLAQEAGLQISDRAIIEGGTIIDAGNVIDDAKKRLEERIRRLENQEKELQAKKDEIAELSMKNDAQEQQNLEKEKEITKLKAEIEEKEKSTDSLNKSTEILNSKLIKDRAYLEEKQKELAEKEEQQLSSQSVVKDMQDKIEQRQNSIEEQKKTLENKKKKSQQNQKEINYITWGALVFVILAIIVFISNQRKKRKNRELITINNQIDNQKEQIISQGKQLQLINKELEKLSIVASQTDNGVVIMDNQGNIEWVNRGFERLSSSNFEIMKDNNRSTFTTLYYSNPQIEEILTKCLENKESISFECPFHTRDNRDIWIQSTLTPILNDNGEIQRLVTIDTDITKIKEQEQSILEQGKVLAVQRDELAMQKEYILEQNENINTSINYAKTIQDTVMPLEVNLSKYFKYFAIFKPLQIVSGDFYWFTRVPDNDKLTFTAVVDCTGHGVAGAFMSMIGTRLLSEIIVEHNIYDPKLILEQLNINLISSLKQGESESDNNDSMEIGLCKFEKLSDIDYELTYSGARRPLYVYHSDTKNFEIFKGNRKTIGGLKSKLNKEEFTDTTILLKKNDIVYQSTDGFVDQFDKDMKKYGTEKFIEKIKSNAHRDINIQKELLLSELDKQLEGSSQTDDITVFAVKLI